MPGPQRVQVPFVGGASRDRSVMVDNQDTVNLMHAIKGVGAKAPVVLESCPGLVDRATIGDGAIRSSKMIQSAVRGSGTDLYGVFGSKLICQTVSSGNLEIGTLDDLANRVVMARGRDYVALVDGSSCYTYDGTTFEKVSDEDLPSHPTHIGYMDGFFIVNDADSDNFFISALEDPTSWNALDFEAASVAPDNALALATTTSLLWILGSETSQPYYNDGNQDFPYAASLSGVQEVGILAPYSLAESDDGIFFLATTPEGGRFVYQIVGQEGRRITGDAQEHLLSTVDDPSEAYGFIYKQAGKSFYVLQLPATSGDDARDSVTLVYNISVQEWERRELQDGSAWRIGGHGILDGKNIGGSRLAGQVLELDLTDYEDSGEELLRRRRTAITHAKGYELNLLEVVIDVDVGVGNFSGDGSDPKVYFRYSFNGRDWSRFLKGSLGKQGQNNVQLRYSKLGQGRNLQFEIQCAEPVPFTIMGAYARLEVLED